jgi:hypothetical protein
MPAFTTIALATSTAAAVAGTGMSFAQAGKQRKAADKAREAAQRAVEEAKAQMGVNYLDALSLPMEAYEAQREAVGQQAADILAEATQGEQRGVGAAAGRIMAARTEAERQLNAEIAQQQFALEQAKRAEDARLGGARASISLAEAEGAQLAAREAEAARARAITQGVQGIGDIAKLGMQAAPLYGKTAAPGTPKENLVMAQQPGYPGASNASDGTYDPLDFSQFLPSVTSLNPYQTRAPYMPINPTAFQQQNPQLTTIFQPLPAFNQ